LYVVDVCSLILAALAIDVLSRIAYYEDEWSFDRKNKFIGLKQSDGWSVAEVKSQNSLAKAGKEMLRIAKDPSGDVKFRKILDAENMDENDFFYVNRKSEKTSDEKLAIDKYWIVRFYNLTSGNELTLSQIRDYKENKLREKAKALRLLGKTLEETIWDDELQRRNKDVFFTDFEHRTKRRELLSGIQEASGIDPIDIMTRANRYAQITTKIEKDLQGIDVKSRQGRAAKAEFKAAMAGIECLVSQEQIDRVAEYVEHRLEVINLFLDSKFEKPTSSEAKTKVFNKTMGELGVTIQKRTKTINKVKHIEYVVDFTKIAEMAAKKDMAKMLRN
jgi:hypothetical protein